MSEDSEKTNVDIPNIGPRNPILLWLCKFDFFSSKHRSGVAQNTLVRVLSFFLTIGLFSTIIFAWFIWSINDSFDDPGPLTESKTFVVERGDSFLSIMPDLELAKIISPQGFLRPFIRGVRSSGRVQELQVGEFAFESGVSMRGVMEQLTRGKPIEYSVTIPEGWTSHQILDRIGNSDFLTGLLPEDLAEGSILADTYNFQRGTERKAVIERMQNAQSSVIAQLWASRSPDLPLANLQEFLILASIVEKETAVGSERPRVASVFVNRLRRGMRLQTDPTVIYGIWGSAGKPKGRGGLRKSELARKTPYNTYQISGLPPTPIAHVGVASLRAVAHPATSDDLFFVADGTGGHVFAKTLAEHNANVAKWRAIERSRNNE